MPSARFILVGGFLGAGKTTALLRLAERLKREGRRVGLITNDQTIRDRPETVRALVTAVGVASAAQLRGSDTATLKAVFVTKYHDDVCADAPSAHHCDPTTGSAVVPGLKAEDMEEPSEENEVPSAENEMAEGYHPRAETAEKAVAEVLGEERNEPEDDEQVDPALLEKLKALLSK